MRTRVFVYSLKDSVAAVFFRLSGEFPQFPPHTTQSSVLSFPFLIHIVLFRIILRNLRHRLKWDMPFVKMYTLQKRHYFR